MIIQSASPSGVAMADMHHCEHRKAADTQMTPAAVLSVIGNRVKFDYVMTLT
jgi:hypothetical protein